MFKNILGLLVILSYSYSYIYPHDPYYQATICGEPLSYIDNCVSVISGCLVHQHPQIVVKGTEPIDLTRMHVSFRYEDPRETYILHELENKYVGWDYFNYFRASAYRTVKAKKYDDHGTSDRVCIKTYFINIVEPSGVILHFSGSRYRDKPVALTLDMETFEKGLINCSSGQMSARLNLKNTKAIREDSYTLRVIQPDGGERVYKSKIKDGCRSHIGNEKYGYQLQTILKPNGNRVHFSYENDDLIKEIKTTNAQETKIYAWAKFHYENKKHFFDTKADNGANYWVTTSDGKKIYFQYQKTKKKDYEYYTNHRYILTDISCNEFHYKYDYQKDHNKTTPMLKSIYTSENRPFFIDYYYCGKKNVEYGEHRRIKRKDERYKRVIALKKPVGQNQELEVVYKFTYKLTDDKTKPNETIVKDAYGNITKYFINDELRIEKIECYIGEDNHYCTEEFLWGTPKSLEVTFLKSKIFYGKDKKPILAKTYKYDEKGNILQETLWGNLSGKSIPLEIENKHPKNNGVEKYTTRFAYSADNRSLLIKIIEDNGLITTLSYLKKKDLIASKLLCFKNRILKREFYEYDNDFSLVKKIVDDGSSNDKSNLENITQRKIEEILPKQTTPFIGLPETILQKVFCKKTNKEILLKKTKYTYDLNGNITQKEIFDSNNEFRFTLYYTYNDRGDLLSETNALGDKTVYTYDLDHNKISSTDASGKKTLYTYDQSNNLTKEEIFKNSSSHYITKHEYNKKNHPIKTIDPRGLETTYFVDLFGHITSKAEPEIITKEGKILSPIYKTTYDGCGRPIKTISPLGNITKREYNVRNQLIKAIFPNQTTEHYIYNLDGTLLRHINKESMITEYSYDLFKRPTLMKTLSASEKLLKQELFVYDNFHLIEKKDPMGNTTKYFYDIAGRKIREIFIHSDKEEAISYFYDSLGFLEKEIHENTNNPLTMLYKRDLLGKVLETRKEDNNTLFSIEKYCYDISGNRSSIIRFIDGQEAVETFTYDLFSRLLQKTDALGNISQILYNDFYRNRFGQLVIQKTEIDCLNQKTITEFDTHERIFSISKGI